MPESIRARDRTACPQGHPYEADNTYRNQGKRLCRACRSAYYTENKDKALERSRVNRSKLTYEQLRAVQLRLYDMTPAEYAIMLQEQGGVCALCKGVQRTGRVLCVDHDHGTGRIRGLLCIRCNSMLGLFERQTVTAVQEYLKCLR